MSDDADNGGTEQDTTQAEQDQQPAERDDTRGKGEQQERGGQGSDGKTFTQAELDQIVADRLTRERRKFGDYDDLKKRAAKLAEIEDAQKSEVEKLNDQLASTQVELQEFRVAETRRKAATEAGLDPEMAEYITSADPDEALAQAKKLADRLKPPEPKTADFRQGSRQPAKQGMTRDELLRGLAGHRT